MLMSDGPVITEVPYPIHLGRTQAPSMNQPVRKVQSLIIVCNLHRKVNIRPNCIKYRFN